LLSVGPGPHTSRNAITVLDLWAQYCSVCVTEGGFSQPWKH